MTETFVIALLLTLIQFNFCSSFLFLLKTNHSLLDNVSFGPLLIIPLILVTYFEIILKLSLEVFVLLLLLLFVHVYQILVMSKNIFHTEMYNNNN